MQSLIRGHVPVTTSNHAEVPKISPWSLDLSLGDIAGGPALSSNCDRVELWNHMGGTTERMGVDVDVQVGAAI